jgi:hypothetical protein
MPLCRPCAFVLCTSVHLLLRSALSSLVVEHVDKFLREARQLFRIMLMASAFGNILPGFPKFQILCSHIHLRYPDSGNAFCAEKISWTLSLDLGGMKRQQTPSNLLKVAPLRTGMAGG